MADNRESYPKNAAGPFYVETGCCISCGVPHQIAPELFAWDDNGHCYVKRQPQTNAETDKAVRVLWGQDVGCIRYRGDDPGLLRRLAELGEQSRCDIAPAGHIDRKFRNHVTFAAVPGVLQLVALDLAEAFKGYLRSQEKEVLESLGEVLDRRKLDAQRYRFTKTKGTQGTAMFSYSWYGHSYHSLEVVRLNKKECEWLIRHSPIERVGSQAVSTQLHDWLIADGRFRSVRWYTASDWSEKRDWRTTPW